MSNDENPPVPGPVAEAGPAHSSAPAVARPEAVSSIWRIGILSPSF